MVVTFIKYKKCVVIFTLYNKFMTHHQTYCSCCYKYLFLILHLQVFKFQHIPFFQITLPQLIIIGEAYIYILWWSIPLLVFEGKIWRCQMERRKKRGHSRNERFLFWSSSPSLTPTTAFWWVLDLLGRVFMVPLCLFSLSSSERLSMS